jgi:hypothetical protein
MFVFSSTAKRLIVRKDFSAYPLRFTCGRVYNVLGLFNVIAMTHFGDLKRELKLVSVLCSETDSAVIVQKAITLTLPPTNLLINSPVTVKEEVGQKSDPSSFIH